MKHGLTILIMGLSLLAMAGSVAAQRPVNPWHSDPTWQAVYWNNPTLSGPPIIRRAETDLAYDWGDGSPDPVIQADRFSARWSRYIVVNPGPHRFTVTADDGLRLWIDEELLIDGWQDQSPTTYTAEIDLTADHHLVQVDYYENSGQAMVQLDWEAIGGPPAGLPEEYLLLYSKAGRLESLPPRPVFDRPEINPIHNQAGPPVEMAMYALSDGPVASPDGRYVVLKAQGREPSLSTWLVDMETGQIERLAVEGRATGDDGEPGPVSWSPDGCCLAFVAAETLYIYEVQSEAGPVPIFSRPGLHRLFARWSPTGEWIAVAGDANPQDTVSPERAYIYWLISPDGATIRNLGQHPVPGYGAVPYNLAWSPDGKTLLTPGQCLISTGEEPATCRSRAGFNLSDPGQWLPRAWVRSFLSQQVERPSLYAWRLSPGGRQIAYSLYDKTARQSALYIFDRSADRPRRVGTVSGYVINEIRWTGRAEFLVAGLGGPPSATEGGPLILLFDAHAGGPPQRLVEGEKLYLLDVIPNHPATRPTGGPSQARPGPAWLNPGPVVDLPGDHYGVVELGPLELPDCCPALSPDGERLAFATCRTMFQKIYIQPVDGSDPKEISSLRINHGDGPCPDPAWSPDGRQLVFVHYDEILYLVNADGTQLTRLEEPMGRDPAWSPDGELIALTAHHGQKGLAIAVMKRDGSDFRLLTDYEARDQRPAWSPDGQRIAFVSDRDGNREIYVMNRDGSDQRRLTDHQAQDWGPVWSPDGEYILFTSDRDGRDGIYVIQRDGSAPTRLMTAEAPGRWPMDVTRVRFVETGR